MTSESSGTGASGLAEPELHAVWLRRYPLRLGARASEHYESVYRELALLASSEEAVIQGEQMAEGIALVEAYEVGPWLAGRLA